MEYIEEELNRLKKLVAQLHSRTQLLSTLLKDAGITVPAEPALEKISPLKWSNKINVDDVDKYLDRYDECKLYFTFNLEFILPNFVPSVVVTVYSKLKVRDTLISVMLS